MIFDLIASKDKQSLLDEIDDMIADKNSIFIEDMGLLVGQALGSMITDSFPLTESDYHLIVNLMDVDCKSIDEELEIISRIISLKYDPLEK